MCIKLNRGYVTPETNLVRVATECGICAGSKDKVVIDNDNTTTTIDSQTDGGDFTLDQWD